jgi:myo-inositol-1(or 4)-monophosphatase
MLPTVTAFVHQAGALVLDAFHRGVAAHHKAPFDVVTEADHAASALLTQLLRDAFPQHGILSEEAPAFGPNDTYWTIDPIDGTKNFCHGHPFFCVSAALIEQGAPILAITHDPVRNETFTAQKHHGAHRNGQPIRVSQTSSLNQALLTSGFPSGKRHRHLDPQIFVNIVNQAQAVRRTGSTALDLAYVAAGRFDAAWDCALEPWDVAAGLLLVTEAGGLTTDWAGRSSQLDSPSLLAANPVLHAGLLQLLTTPPNSTGTVPASGPASA